MLIPRLLVLKPLRARREVDATARLTDCFLTLSPKRRGNSYRRSAQEGAEHWGCEGYVGAFGAVDEAFLN